jgi:hypothetical protein
MQVWPYGVQGQNRLRPRWQSGCHAVQLEIKEMRSEESQ